jgi:glycosyltransferase involved in cell wall biosynthesis
MPLISETSSGPSAYPPGLGVNVVGFISGSLGLGVAARTTIAALVDAGITVATVDVQLPGRSGADNSYADLEVQDASRLPHPMTIVHMNPPDAAVLWIQHPQWFTETYNCIVPFLELAELQQRWPSLLSQYDAILAPTEYIGGAIRSAMAARIRSFPMAASSEEVEPIERYEFGIPEDKVAFAASWDAASGANRKNGLGVLRAFGAALDLGVDAVLVLKLNNQTSQPKLARALKQLPAGRVITVSEYLPYPRLLGLYSACDVYISLHRAEGLGLGMQEAMLLGKPVIATGWSGNMDFMDDGSAALVQYTLTPAVDPHPDYEPGLFARPPLWAEPDVLDAARHIYRLANEESLRIALGAAGQQRMTRYRDIWKQAAPAQLASLYADYLRNG